MDYFVDIAGFLVDARDPDHAANIVHRLIETDSRVPEICEVSVYDVTLHSPSPTPDVVLD